MFFVFLTLWGFLYFVVSLSWKSIMTNVPQGQGPPSRVSPLMFPPSPHLGVSPAAQVSYLCFLSCFCWLVLPLPFPFPRPPESPVLRR